MYFVTSENYVKFKVWWQQIKSGHSTMPIFLLPLIVSGSWHGAVAAKLNCLHRDYVTCKATNTTWPLAVICEPQILIKPFPAKRYYK